MMGIDYYSCEICSEAFPDVVHYGHCGKCAATLCGHCFDRMREENGELGEEHEKANYYGEHAPNSCDSCNGTVIDTTKFFEFLADKLGQSTEELEAEYRATLLNETEG